MAFGKLLFGDETFSGKLPFTWVAQADLPAFQGGSTTALLDYFFGYRLYDALEAAGVFPIEPVFPFGHGLSYTTFEYSNLELPCSEVDPDSVLDVSVEVENTGSVQGSEVVMLFVQGPPKPVEVTGERAPKELRGFARVELAANETQRVTIPLRIQDLRHWEGNADGEYVLDPGEYSVLVGPNSAELTLQGTSSVKN
jgi:beta-glucosidase